MSYYLFDSPVGFFIAGGIVELIAIVFYFISQRGWRALTLLAGPLVVMCGIGLDYAVETDREQVVGTVDQIVKASVTPNVGAIIGTLHDDIEIGGKDLNQIIVILRKYFNKKIISSNNVKSIEIISLDDHDAVAEFTALTVFDQDGEYAMAGMTTSKWRFEFAKNVKGKFKITYMEMLSLGNSTPMKIF